MTTNLGLVIRCVVMLNVVALLGVRAYAAEPPAGEQAPADAPAGSAGGSEAPGARLGAELSCAPAPTHETTEWYWYGSTIMLADAAALAAIYVGFEQNSRDPASLGFASLLLNGPVIHLFKRQGLRSLLSLGLRVGLPSLLLAVVPEQYCESGSFPCTIERQATYAGVALAGAIVLDWALLSRARRTVKKPVDSASWSVAPTFAVTERGASLGVLGRF